MNNDFKQRTLDLQSRMSSDNIDVLVTTNPDSIYYLSGVWGYVRLEFGRPTILVIPKSGEPVLIAGQVEEEMAKAMTWLDHVEVFADGVGDEWRTPLLNAMNAFDRGILGVEMERVPGFVLQFLRQEAGTEKIVDGGRLLIEMRMIKTPQEIEILRQAGQVVAAMATSGREVIADGVPEYEVALAAVLGGTRKAAEIMGEPEIGSFDSPVIHGHQSIQSGPYTSMGHRRSTMRRIRKGEPVFMCFCGIAQFKHMKPGFDRTFYVSQVSDEDARIYGIGLAAQQAAIAAIRPGVTANEVSEAAIEVYREADYFRAIRTGRAIGFAVNEAPQLKSGDQTVLKAGMAFCVDGGITQPGKRAARVGDSVVVTENGCEYLTDFPRDLAVL